MIVMVDKHDFDWVTPSVQDAILNKLIAAAVTTCCKWVLDRPRYRERRSPLRLTACAWVLSIPARAAYVWRNSSVSCRTRIAFRAS
jgi:hypothetical protein